MWVSASCRISSYCQLSRSEISWVAWRAYQSETSTLQTAPLWSLHCAYVSAISRSDLVADAVDWLSQICIKSVTAKSKGLYCNLFIILYNISPSIFLLRAGITSCSDGIRAGWPGFDSRQGQVFFLFNIALRPSLGFTQPPIPWVSWEISPGVKWPGREVDRSPRSSAEVKSGGAISPLHHVSSCHSA
jgi:hypothetical protein